MGEYVNAVNTANELGQDTANLDAETLARIARIQALVKHLHGDTLQTPRGQFKAQAMEDPNRTQMKGSRPTTEPKTNK